MTKEIELAKQHGIQYRLTPEGTTEMWCHDRNVQAFAEALMAAERERWRAHLTAHLDHTVMSCYASRHECEAARNALQRALDELA